jgi:deoxyribodipyrimidine photolyase
MLEEHGKGRGASGINVPSALDQPREIKFSSTFEDEMEAACSDFTVLKKVPELHELSQVFGDIFKNIDTDAVTRNAYFKGGETEALKRLQTKVIDQIDFVCKFKKPETSSTTSAVSMFREPSTTGLSPYLAHGCLSVRKFWNTLDATFEKKKNAKVDNLAMSLYGQLLFREMFYILNESIGENFSENVKANTVINKFVEWDAYNPKLMQAWEDGKTGYPFIDALMRQMNTTGWMHNRLRMITAMFLTKHLFIDWRWGEKYFMENLIVADLASNNGGWQWSASTGVDAVPYFRIFNPTRQSQRFDTKGIFIRQYVPELASLDNKSIHSPSREQVEQVGYLNPIVDHASSVKQTKMWFKGLDSSIQL